VTNKKPPKKKAGTIIVSVFFLLLLGKIRLFVIANKLTMEDSQVYERIDGVLKDTLTQKSLKDNYQELLKNPDIELAKQCVRQYFDSIGYTFLNNEQSDRFIFKGKEVKF
jgi:hypothetical protein